MTIHTMFGAEMKNATLIPPLIWSYVYTKASIFPPKKTLFIQGRFNKLIYGINMHYKNMPNQIY